MSQWRAWTDGACRPNPGPGGWGVVLIDPSGSITELSGGETATTNNRMEFEAIAHAVASIPEGERGTVYSDSLLAVNILEGRWRGRKMKPLAREIHRLLANREIKFQWVKGHAGNRWNERADVLAGAAIDADQTQHNCTADMLKSELPIGI